MKDTQHTLQLDADIAQLLQTNPAAAHFVADLASGVDFKQAVADHFGEFFASSTVASSETSSSDAMSSDAMSSETSSSDAMSSEAMSSEAAVDAEKSASDVPKKACRSEAEQAPMYAPVGIAPADQAAAESDADDLSADSFLVFRPSVWD